MSDSMEEKLSGDHTSDASHLEKDPAIRRALSPTGRTVIVDHSVSKPPPTWIPIKSYMQRYCEPFFAAIERWRNCELEYLFLNRIHAIDSIRSMYEQYSLSQKIYVFSIHTEHLNYEILPEVMPCAGRDYCMDGDKKAFESAKRYVPQFLFHRIGVYFQSLLLVMAGRNDSYLKSANPIVRKSLERCFELLLRLPEEAGKVHFVYKTVDKEMSDFTEADYAISGSGFLYQPPELSNQCATLLKQLSNSRGPSEASFIKEDHKSKIALDQSDDDEEATRKNNQFNQKRKSRVDFEEVPSSDDDVIFQTSRRLTKPASAGNTSSSASKDLQKKKLVISRSSTQKSKENSVRMKPSSADSQYAPSKAPRSLAEVSRRKTAEPVSSIKLTTRTRKLTPTKSSAKSARKASTRSSGDNRPLKRRKVESSEEESDDSEESDDEEEDSHRRESGKRSARTKSLVKRSRSTAQQPKKKKAKRPLTAREEMARVMGTKVATYLFVPSAESNNIQPEVRLFTGEIVDFIPPTKPKVQDQKYIAKWYDDKDQEEYILDVKAFQNAIDLYQVNCSWTVKHTSIGSKVADYFFIPGIVKGAVGAQKIFVGKVSKYCPPSSSKVKDQLYHILWEDGDEQDYDEFDYQKGRRTYKSLIATKQLQRSEEDPITIDDDEDDEIQAEDGMAHSPIGDRDEAAGEKEETKPTESGVTSMEVDGNDEGIRQQAAAMKKHVRTWTVEHASVFTKIATEKEKKGKKSKKVSHRKYEDSFREEDHYNTGIVIKYSPETFEGAGNQRYLIKWNHNNREEILTEEEYQEGLKVATQMFVDKLNALPFLPGLEVYEGRKSHGRRTRSTSKAMDVAEGWSDDEEEEVVMLKPTGKRKLLEEIDLLEDDDDDDDEDNDREEESENVAAEDSIRRSSRGRPIKPKATSPPDKSRKPSASTKTSKNKVVSSASNSNIMNHRLLSPEYQLSREETTAGAQNEDHNNEDIINIETSKQGVDSTDVVRELQFEPVHDVDEADGDIMQKNTTSEANATKDITAAENASNSMKETEEKESTVNMILNEDSHAYSEAFEFVETIELQGNEVIEKMEEEDEAKERTEAQTILQRSEDSSVWKEPAGNPEVSFVVEEVVSVVEQVIQSENIDHHNHHHVMEATTTTATTITASSIEVLAKQEEASPSHNLVVGDNADNTKEEMKSKQVNHEHHENGFVLPAKEDDNKERTVTESNLLVA